MKIRRLRLVALMLAVLVATTVAVFLRNEGHVFADLSAPAWWNGTTCDTAHYTGAHALGASYNGVAACGPRPYYDGSSDLLVHFFTGAWGENEWECTELVSRYMYLAYGISPYNANGKDVVGNYSGTTLTAVNNDGTALPSPGDIISEAATATNSFGHTVVVTGVSVTNGSGTVSAMQQNSSADGVASITVTGNKLGSNVTGWLHNATNTSNSSVRTISTSDGHIQTFKISNGALSENWYNRVGGATGTWTNPPGMPSTPTGTPAVVQRTGQNVLDVFVHGSNNQLYETWYNYQNGSWGGWIGMGGGPSGFTSDPQAVVAADGSYQVFGTGGGRIEQIWFTANGNYGGWTTSAALSATAVGSPALDVRTSQYAVNVFVRGNNNQLYETWFSYQTNSWGGWIGMGGGPLGFTSDPQVQQTSDGSDQVFGTGSGLVEQNWYNQNGTSGGWISF